MAQKDERDESRPMKVDRSLMAIEGYDWEGSQRLQAEYVRKFQEVMEQIFHDMWEKAAPRKEP